MSDYLNKLVLRTLGTRPAAQPLMPPFYAPDSTLSDGSMLPAAPLNDSLGTANFANDELVPNQRPAIASRQTASVEKPTPPSLDKHTPAQNLTVITEPNTPLIPGLTDQASARKIKTPRQQAPAIQQLPKITASTTSDALGERQGEPMAISALPQSEPGRSGSRPPAQSATQPVEMIVDRRLVANHQALPTLVQAGPMATQPTEATHAPFGAPPVTPGGRHNSQPREVASERAAPPTPTIQVTIGRVEVRAIQPPAPAVRAQPKAATPAIALEDYLRGQTGGQR